MPVTLKPETLQSWPPGGWILVQALPNGQIWRAPSPLNFNFRQQVQNIVNWRKSNPIITSKLKLSLDPDVVAQEMIDQTVARLKYLKGADSYLKYDDAVKLDEKKTASIWEYVKKGVAAAVTGEETLRDWLGSGGKPVERELAESRARICSDCPQNTKSHWSLSLFGTAAQAVKSIVELKNGMKLKTSYDDKLGVCKACLCPLETKVHVPLAHIFEYMDDETKQNLDPRCWITSEEMEL